MRTFLLSPDRFFLVGWQRKCYDNLTYHNSRRAMEQELISKNIFTHEQAIILQKETTWQKLSNISLLNAIKAFLDKLSPHTRRAYEASFNIFFNLGLLNPNLSLQEFSLCNLETLLDLIKEKVEGTEATKQARCASLISLTGFLSRRTQGMIRKAVPCKDNGASTFKKIRSLATTRGLNRKRAFYLFKSVESY